MFILLLCSHCDLPNRPNPPQHMYAHADRSMWEAFRCNKSCSWVFSGRFCWVFTPSHLELRTNARLGVRTSWAGMICVHNICYCCMTCLVTLRIATPQSTNRSIDNTAYRHVWKTERYGAERVVCSRARGWVEGTVIDCTAATFNYVCLQSMLNAAGAKVTFLYSDYSCLLCGSAVLYFLMVPRCIHWQ